MKFHRSYARLHKTWLVVLIFIIVFVVAVAWFRSSKSEETPTVDSIVGVLTPEPLTDETLARAIDIYSKEASLSDVRGGTSTGKAQRGTKDERYFLSVGATLPEIDRATHHYEVWLLQKIPYAYFSVGEMVTDESGAFVVEWEGERDGTYRAYTDVIVTLEASDGNLDPSEHVLEGTFGK